MVAPIIGAGDGYTDLLGLDAEFEFVSPERKALMDAAEDAQHGGVAVEPMEIDMQRDALTARQDAHHELTRSTLDFYNPAPRPIKAHQFRRNRGRLFNRYPLSNQYSSRSSNYRDPDDSRGRAFHYERRNRQPSLETLHSPVEATIVSSMADLDVKEEREDRRDGDRYRGGGNNKRRRDGKLATGSSEGLCKTDTGR
jgi:hypothetical protein